jgi:hypothetical protein
MGITFFAYFTLFLLIYLQDKTQTMENIEYYYNMIENCITNLGADPKICRGEKPGQWDLKKGSAKVWIDIWKQEGEEYGYFQAMAPVVEIPKMNREAFFKEILEINHKLYGVGMTVFENWVYIKTVRELDNFSEGEALAMLNRIGNYADDYDDVLLKKYHAGTAPLS